MSISFSSHISVPEDVLVRELEGESVILNLLSEEYFGLDDVGTTMWEALVSHQPVESAYQSLLMEYDVEPELLRKDLSTLLNELTERGLLEVE